MAGQAGSRVEPNRAIPFVRHMLELSSLDSGIQGLVVVGFSVVLAAALLLTLTGLQLQQVQLFQVGGQPYRIALIFLWAVIFVFSIGWGYVLAAVVGSNQWLRWPALVLFTIAILYQVVSTLSNAQTNGIQLDAVLVLQIAAPQLALLVPVWTIAAFRAIANRPGITPFTVLGMIGSVLLYFVVYYSMLQLVGESNLGLPVVDLLPISLTLLFPLYLLAGVDLTELLFLTGVGAWAWCDSRLGRRASWMLALVVAATGLAVEGILDRGAFLRIGSLAYAAAWIVSNLLFLRWVIPRVRIDQEASYSLLFVVVIVAWFGGGNIGLPIPPLFGSVPNAVCVAGAGCLLAATAIWLHFRWRLIAAILLLGVMGIWMLFSYLPALFGISTSPGDLLGESVVGSSLALFALGFAAEKYVALVLWRTVGTVWTLGMTLMDAYRLAVIHGASFYDVLPAVEVGILLVALGLVLVSVPLPLRIAGVGVALVSLLGSVYFASHGGPLPMVAIANATLMAIALVWEVLMSGRRITNRNGHLWPRNSRVIGFIGYALVGLGAIIFVASAEGYPSAAAGFDVRSGGNFFQAIGLVVFGVPTIVYALRAAWRPDGSLIQLKAEF